MFSLVTTYEIEPSSPITTYEIEPSSPITTYEIELSPTVMPITTMPAGNLVYIFVNQNIMKFLYVPCHHLIDSVCIHLRILDTTL